MRRTPDRRIMQSKRSLTFTSPLSFFLAFSKATTTKSHTLKHTKETLNRKERRLFDFSPFLLGLHFIPTKETETLNKWFYVFHIFFGVCIRKRSTPVWWSSVSVVLTPRCICAEIISIVVLSLLLVQITKSFVVTLIIKINYTIKLTIL